MFKAPAALGGATQEGTLRLLAALDGRPARCSSGSTPRGRSAQCSTSPPAPRRSSTSTASTPGICGSARTTREPADQGRDPRRCSRPTSWLMLDADGVGHRPGCQLRRQLEVRAGPAHALGVDRRARRRCPWRPAAARRRAGPRRRGRHRRGAVRGRHRRRGRPRAAQTFTPYLVAGTLSVVVGLPTPLKDLDVDIRLEWTRGATPTVEDPWSGALLEHERCTESWPTVSGGSTDVDPAVDAPVVPLDARVLLSFTQPMDDETAVADNPPDAVPVVAIGENDATYTLAELTLHRRRRSHPDAGWQDVTDTVFGTWTVDAGDAGTRLQLLARSPFAFTRFTSRRWTDSFLAAHPVWPCDPPPPAVRSCVDWRDLPVDTRTGSLWVQGGVTFTTKPTSRGSGWRPRRARARPVARRRWRLPAARCALGRAARAGRGGDRVGVGQSGRPRHAACLAGRPGAGQRPARRRSRRAAGHGRASMRSPWSGASASSRGW